MPIPDDPPNTDGYSIGFGYSLDPKTIERYGLSLDDYHAHLDAQGGNCAICERPPGSVGPLEIDHDHVTGAVRGLLCGRCNRGLGLFLDNPHFLRSAAEYVQQRTPADPKIQSAIAEISDGDATRRPVSRATRDLSGGRLSVARMLATDTLEEMAVKATETADIAPLLERIRAAEAVIDAANGAEHLSRMSSAIDDYQRAYGNVPSTFVPDW